jgi:hypothetical protein
VYREEVVDVELCRKATMEVRAEESALACELVQAPD